MLQREKYIKNITSRLSQLKAYIELCGDSNLTDVHIIAEDFICGLLNRAFGYSLVNENHQHKNAPAYDLVDEEKGILIQVTAKKTHDKIQGTIDGVIKCGMYAKCNRLIIQLLGDKPAYKKSFDTKNQLQFDPESDIWDFKALMRDIRKLDTETLEKVNDYVENEISNRLEIIGRNPGGRELFVKKAICIAAAVIVIFLITVAVVFTRFSNDRVGKVFFSKLRQYTEAGYYTYYEDRPFVKQTSINVKKAFSIVSELRNEGKKSSVVEEVYCNILSVVPIEEPVLILDAVVTGDMLKFYVFNDGWNDAENLDIVMESWVSGMNPDIENPDAGALERIAECTYMADCSELKSADVLPLAEYVIDRAEFQNVCTQTGSSSLHIGLKGMSGDTEMFSWSGYLGCADGKFDIDYGGRGDSGYNISLFAVLNVDDVPSSLSFAGQDAMSIVEDALIFETVIAPTKSCIVECQDVFYINGGAQQTPVYTVEVKVPVFADGAIGMSGALTTALAELLPEDRIGIERLTAEYYYQAESIQDTFPGNE
ncbi:SMEK domain-containing protein [Acetatifactor aquisgranensis]|uniref:SMEK domain-containing protein n=1 Tax=Acetatifactor aquisgranensis TaxID=2941233 RepID=UPI00203E4BF2|nr:SMEK domain-containing protein [Acetatifactor aquisgranensis]